MVGGGAGTGLSWDTGAVCSAAPGGGAAAVAGTYK